MVTTNLRSAEEVLLSSGDVVSGVLANAAIPGVLPPIDLEGANGGPMWPNPAHFLPLHHHQHDDRIPEGLNVNA